MEDTYKDRKAYLDDDLADTLGWSQHRARTLTTKKIRQSALTAERNELARIRREREVEETLWRQMERELDLDEARMKN